MKQYKEDQLATCGQVVPFLAENSAALAKSPMAVQQAAAATTLYGKVAGTRGGTAKCTKKLTDAAKTARETLLKLLPALLAPPEPGGYAPIRMTTCWPR